MNQTAAKIGTAVAAAAIVAMIGYSVVNSSEKTSPPSINPSGGASKPVNRDIVLGGFGNDRKSSADDSSFDVAKDGSLPSLSVGVIGSTPMRREVTRIETIPFTATEVRRAYRDSAGRTCRIVIPGAPVIPPSGDTGRSAASTYGRVPALTIGLSLDPAAASKLPTVVRAQVRGYLDKHRLSIQPTLYQDNTGELYFGTDCQSAFYELKRPTLTVEAESMVNTAIERFRALGVVGSASNAGELESSSAFGRTLALAFTFEKTDPASSTETASKTVVTEIMLLHLPPDSAQRISEGKRPRIEVYITSDSRATLNRVASNGRDLTSPVATIESDVRFESTVLMGMYPADPVVSSIRYRSEGVVGMNVIRRMVRGESASGKRDQTPMSVTAVLDRFGELSSRGG